MSDRDSDGRLGCEEFVLALYLCEMVATGKTLPAELPQDLIPPSFRKAPSRHGSVVNSRHGSVSSQGNVSLHGDFDPALGMSQGKKKAKRFFSEKLYETLPSQHRLRISEKKTMTRDKRN
jgi:intersectin